MQLCKSYIQEAGSPQGYMITYAHCYYHFITYFIAVIMLCYYYVIITVVIIFAVIMYVNI